MFIGIDEIDWWNLAHAYGNDKRIPKLIKAAATDETRCHQHIKELRNLINHQGDIYECTAAAMPFLIELLDYVKAECRVDLLVLIGDTVANANADFMSELYRFHQGEKVHNWRSLPLLEAVYKAVAGGYETYINLLTDDEKPNLRVWAIRLIAILYDRIEISIPIIVQTLEIESNADARRDMLTAVHSIVVGYSLSDESCQILQSMLVTIVEDEAEERDIRLAAVYTAVTLSQDLLSLTARNLLLQTLVDRQDLDLRIHNFNLSWFVPPPRIKYILNMAGVYLYEPANASMQATETLWDAEQNVTKLAEELVERYFTKGVAPTELSFGQQIVVALLLYRQSLWLENKDVLEFLANYGLPTTYTTLKAWLTEIWK